MNDRDASSSQAFSLHVRRLLTRTSDSWGILSTHPARIDDMTIETGTVKWFNESKGFGFIAPGPEGPAGLAHPRRLTRAATDLVFGRAGDVIPRLAP